MCLLLENILLNLISSPAWSVGTNPEENRKKAGSNVCHGFPKTASCRPGEHLFTRAVHVRLPLPPFHTNGIVVASVASHAPSTTLSLSRASSHLTLSTTSEGRRYHVHFIDCKTESQELAELALKYQTFTITPELDFLLECLGRESSIWRERNLKAT